MQTTKAIENKQTEIIVITPENGVRREAYWINALLASAHLDLLHIRKPGFDLQMMYRYIQAIDEAYHEKIVLHDHHELTDDFAIQRLHYREKNRLLDLQQPDPNSDFVYSTAVHTIADFNALCSQRWNYAFFSPFFPSISKPGYGEKNRVMSQLADRTNDQVKLIALGGIHADNLKQIPIHQVDGIALLGAIWQGDDPIQIIEKCTAYINYTTYHRGQP